MWYKFNSQEHFNTWHEQIKTQLGIPLPDGITTSYTNLLVKDNGELYAFVEDKYAQGLEQTDKPLDKPKA